MHVLSKNQTTNNYAKKLPSKRILKFGTYCKPKHNQSEILWLHIIKLSDLYLDTNITIYFRINMRIFSILFHIFIFGTRKKMSKALQVGQPSSNYPDLLLKMSRYCCPVETFFLVLYFY